MTSNIRSRRGVAPAFALAGLVFLIVASAPAQQAPPAAQPQKAGPGVTFTATTANVVAAGGAVKINVLRWSTDEERSQLVAALNPPARGAAPAAAPAPAAGAAAGGRGGAAGRGGRGAPAGPVDPVAALAAAIGKAPGIGYIWTTAGVGYSIRYAYRVATPDGGERIILATDPRLGSFSPADWKVAAPATPTDYEFSVIEMRLDSKGLGEGKASLNTKVAVDADAKTIALDNYVAAPAILKNVKK